MPSTDCGVSGLSLSFVGVDPCPAGFAVGPATQQCTPCPPGQSTDASGLCSPCASGKIAPYPGTATCALCNPNSDPNADHTWCLCRRGFYPANASSPFGDCAACPFGAQCIGDNALPLAAPSFFKIGGPPASGFVRCPSAAACLGGNQCAPGHVNLSRLCVECQSGYFAGGSGACSRCSQQPGVWGLVAVAGALLAVAGCAIALFLKPPEAINRMWHECALAVLSVAPVVTLALTGLGTGTELAVVSLCCIVMLVYFVLQHFNRRQQLRQDAIELSGVLGDEAADGLLSPECDGDSTTGASAFCSAAIAADHIQNMAKGLVIYLQSLGAIASASGAVPTGAAATLLSVAGLANVQVSGLECAGVGYLGRMRIFALVLPCLVATVGAVYALRVYLLERQRQSRQSEPGLESLVDIANRRARSKLRRRALLLCAALFYFFAFPLLQSALSVFALDQSGFGGPRWMRTAPWIDAAMTGLYAQLVAVAAVILLLLCAATGWLCWSVYSAATSNARRSAVAFLYRGYWREVWWFEGVIGLRRVGLALLCSLVPVASPLLASLTGALLLISAILHGCLQAFAASASRFAELVGLVALSQSAFYLQCCAFGQRNGSGEADTAQTWLVVANCAALFVFIAAGTRPIASRLLSLARDRPKDTAPS
eukprot:c15263_g1_i1.p1 GENE.c15263_g1_i1~~c15263_g1_i1.p1  ORF type:complete len:656 (+),score=72.73 c15263_g1_i1:578-2545(+)